jgi:hypothetical protein
MLGGCQPGAADAAEAPKSIPAIAKPAQSRVERRIPQLLGFI